MTKAIGNLRASFPARLLRSSIWFAFTSAFAVASVGGCGQSPSNSGSAAECTADLASIQASIFVPSCGSAACHGGAQPAANLDLTKADLSPELVGASAATCDGWARVVPGSSDKSFLFQKLSAASPACGDPMPSAGPHLSSAQLGCLKQWIDGLAASGSCEKCGGSDCVTLASDSQNCGACGVKCPAGIACQNGICACSAGTSACGEQCVDLQTDTAHCGACGTACPSGSSCASGQCKCSAGLVACDTECADLQADGQHCGACGTACQGGQVCLLGKCATGCGALMQCGASCVDVTTSVANCGACGHACGSGLACVAGKCACPNGGTLCGSACVDTSKDPANCGACGKQCGAGEACSNGSCGCSPNSVSFSSVIQAIFTANCTASGCHSGRMPKEGLSLVSGQAYGNLVNVKTNQCGGGRLRVLPGKPSQSYLLQKLSNVDLCSGSQMPKAGQSLPASELAAISGWVCAGAPKN